MRLGTTAQLIADYEAEIKENAELRELLSMACGARDKHYEEVLELRERAEKAEAVLRTSVRMRHNQIEGQKFVTTASYGSESNEWQRRAEECRQGIIEWENAVDAYTGQGGQENGGSD